MKYIKNAYLPELDQIVNLKLSPDSVEIVTEVGEGEVIDAQNRIVINSYVDKHTHLDKSNLTKLIQNTTGTLKEAIEKTKNLKPQLTQEMIYENAEQTLLKMIENGVGYVRTHVDVDKFIKLNGLKAILQLRNDYKDKIKIEIVAFPQEGFINDKENHEILIESLDYKVDYVGGIPLNDSDPKAHIEEVFRLAKEHNLGVDMHVDESDNPDDLSILTVIEIANKYKLDKTVTVGHLCSLYSQDPNKRKDIIQQIKEANIEVISLPSTNLYLQGRNDEVNPRRGMAPIKEMLAQHLKVSIGSDNFRDMFNPFGNGILLEEALIAAHAGHMGSPDDLKNLFNIITTKVTDTQSNEYLQHSLLILDETKVEQAIINQVSIHRVVKY